MNNKCTKCGKSFNQVQNSGKIVFFQNMPYCSDCYEAIKNQGDVKEYSRVFIIISVLTGILGFISGIICGDVYKISVLENTWSDDYIEVFNSGLMLGIWSITFAAVVLFLIISAILKNQEIIIKELKKINQHR